MMSFTSHCNHFILLMLLFTLVTLQIFYVSGFNATVCKQEENVLLRDDLYWLKSATFYSKCIIKYPGDVVSTADLCSNNDCKECIKPCEKSWKTLEECKIFCLGVTPCHYGCYLFYNMTQNHSSIVGSLTAPSVLPEAPEAYAITKTDFMVKWNAVSTVEQPVMYVVFVQAYTHTSVSKFEPLDITLSTSLENGSIMACSKYPTLKGQITSFRFKVIPVNPSGWTGSLAEAPESEDMRPFEINYVISNFSVSGASRFGNMPFNTGLPGIYTYLSWSITSDLSSSTGFRIDYSELDCSFERSGKYFTSRLLGKGFQYTDIFLENTKADSLAGCTTTIKIYPLFDCFAGKPSEINHYYEGCKSVFEYPQNYVCPGTEKVYTLDLEPKVPWGRQGCYRSHNTTGSIGQWLDCGTYGSYTNFTVTWRRHLSASSYVVQYGPLDSFLTGGSKDYLITVIIHIETYFIIPFIDTSLGYAFKVIALISGVDINKALDATKLTYLQMEVLVPTVCLQTEILTVDDPQYWLQSAAFYTNCVAEFEDPDSSPYCTTPNCIQCLSPCLYKWSRLDTCEDHCPEDSQSCKKGCRIMYDILVNPSLYNNIPTAPAQLTTAPSRSGTHLDGINISWNPAVTNKNPVSYVIFAKIYGFDVIKPMSIALLPNAFGVDKLGCQLFSNYIEESISLAFSVIAVNQHGWYNDASSALLSSYMRPSIQLNTAQNLTFINDPLHYSQDILPREKYFIEFNVTWTIPPELANATRLYITCETQNCFDDALETSQFEDINVTEVKIVMETTNPGGFSGCNFNIRVRHLQDCFLGIPAELHYYLEDETPTSFPPATLPSSSFHTSLSPSSLQPTTEKPQQTGGLGTVAIAAIAIGILVFIIVLTCIICCYKLKTRKLLNFGLDEQDVNFDLSKYDKWEIPSRNIIVGKVVGEGAFGKVYIGRVKGAIIPNDSHEEKSNNVGIKAAIKMLQPSAGEQQSYEFHEEIKLMKELGHHKNVVNMLGCCTHTDPICLIVEYMPNGDLLHYLRKKRDGDQSIQDPQRNSPPASPRYKFSNPSRLMSNESRGSLHRQAKENSGFDAQSNTMGHATEENDSLSPKDLLSFSWQIASGMEFLAGKGFVHRDLAARNVLVGLNNTAKISDFGLSRFVYEEKMYTAQKNRRLPLKWMSTEAIFDQVFTSKSDVWAFGVVLFEIATLGGTPYPTIDNRDLLRLLRSGYRMEKPDNCSDEIYNIMLQCWREKADERPTFEGLRETFDELLQEGSAYIDFNVDEQSDYYKVASFASIEEDHSELNSETEKYFTEENKNPRKDKSLRTSSDDMPLKDLKPPMTPRRRSKNELLDQSKLQKSDSDLETIVAMV